MTTINAEQSSSLAGKDLVTLKISSDPLAPSPLNFSQSGVQALHNSFKERSVNQASHVFAIGSFNTDDNSSSQLLIPTKHLYQPLPDHNHLTRSPRSKLVHDGVTGFCKNSSLLNPQDNFLLVGQRSTTSKSIVFVDPNISDYRSLIQNLKGDRTVVVLDPNQDGISQISNALANRQGIKSIHILSHGSSGNMQIGNTHLNASTLGAYTDQFKGWQKSMTHEADILLYGCNIAEGTKGEQFVRSFSQLTGADIQASTDLTGSAALNGDWKLELSTGTIEAKSPFLPAVEKNYAALLPEYLHEPFPGRVYFSDGVALRNSTNFDDRVPGRALPKGNYTFTDWTNGQGVKDPANGQIDTLWYKYKIAGDAKDYWVPGAFIDGYPRIGNAPPSSSLVNNISDGNKFHKTQFYNPAYNPDGPSRSGNCGPTSLAIALKELGLEPPNLSVQASINRASDLMKRNRNAGFTSWAQIETGIRSADRTPQYVGSWSALDSFLEAGKPVLCNGWYGGDWRSQFPSYSQTGTGNTMHLNTVVGKTSDGRYLVSDPMYRAGCVAMSKAQLSVFFQGSSGYKGNPVGLAVA